MTKRVSSKRNAVSRPPQGEPWVWLSCELIASPAWRAQGIHCRRFIDFLMREHMAHAGHENGNLGATYSQLVSWGIGRRFISNAIREAEALALVEVKRGGKRNHVEDHISRYRLTWLAWKDGVLYKAATDEWKKITLERAQAVRLQRKNRLQVHYG